MGNRYTKIPIDINKAIKLYESGLTQEEVGKLLGTTQKVIYSRLKQVGYKSRIAKKRNQWGSHNSSWKGDSASYAALHYRVYKLRGKPTFCEVCGISDSNTGYQWASLTKNYKEPSDYKAMCRSCHSKFDKFINNITKGVM